MTLNVLGWAGMTIVGTVISLLPTILHVRAPRLGSVRAAPWLMFLGLMVMSADATTELNWIGGVGMSTYLVDGGVAWLLPPWGLRQRSSTPPMSHASALRA
jgi:nitrite reductase (NO-forming)